MGNQSITSIRKLSFEDIQHIIRFPDQYVMIHTMPDIEQQCLIPHTVEASQETTLINQFVEQRAYHIPIIIYSAHSNDDRLYHKYKQLTTMGFEHVYVYAGGMFEWLLLQDVYGKEHFPTTTPELHLLKYKPPKQLIVNRRIHGSY